MASGAATQDPLAVPSYVRGPGSFALHYIGSRRWAFACLLLMVLTGSSCSVGVQYASKFLVDALNGGSGSRLERVVVLFVVLIAAESALSRLTGWLTCKTTVEIGVDVKLDLFGHLSGHSMRYFAENLAGSLGQRITASAGHFGALVNTIVSRISRPR